MNTTEFLAMQSEYSAKTKGAKDVIDASFPLLQKALKDLLPNFDHPVFGLADFGAADGGTSLELMLRTIEEVRSVHPDLPIHLNYSDLPENDFNAIGRMLNNLDGKGMSILGKYPHLTVSSSPVSFYHQILPPNQLTLGFSATAMHWLEFAPGNIRDHVHIAASQDEEAKALYRQKSHTDLVKILDHRQTEMQSGAYFLLVNFGINDNGQFLGNTEGVHMFDHFYSLLSQMVAEKKITAEELQNMNFPQYYRSKEDYHAAVADEQLSNQLEIVQINDLHTPCPYREAFRATGDEATFVESYPGTLQTWSYQVFYVGLSKERSEMERNTLVREFFSRYERDIRQRPQEHGMDYIHHLVLFRKK